MSLPVNYRGLEIPKTSFGAVSSDDLFNAKEQEIFDFYERNRSKYKRALDIGANIGIHAMLMERVGWEVKAFEPDPQTFQLLLANLRQYRVEPHCQAVSDRSGRATFVRVSNNTTGSHLDGFKSPYGPVERFEVDCLDCRPLFEWADFAKIDCEGAEADILETVTNEGCEYMAEIGNANNAKRIFEHFTRLGMRIRAQKNKWALVTGIEDMPIHHSQGMVFIGKDFS